jgi:hypothetical protein
MPIKYTSVDVELPPLGKWLAFIVGDEKEDKKIGRCYLTITGDRKYSYLTNDFFSSPAKGWAEIPEIKPKEIAPLGRSIFFKAKHKETGTVVFSIGFFCENRTSEDETDWEILGWLSYDDIGEEK